MRISAKLFVAVACFPLSLMSLPAWAAPLPAPTGPTLFAATAAPSTIATPAAAPAVPAASLAAADAAVTESTPRIQTIGVARHRPVGTRVTIEGSVTVPSGTFSSSFGDEGFAIQDFTGGVYVSTVDNLGLKLQDRVRVTGVITESGGLISVVPAGASGVTDEETAYLGDDLPDMPLSRRAGFAIAVANAAPELKAISHYVTERRGGEGAAREVVELILKAQGVWETAIPLALA